MTTALMECADALHALGDGNRLAILDCLASAERCVCELTEATGLKQSLLSFHLRVLRDAGLVKDRRVGRWSFYSIDDEAMQSVARRLGRLGQTADRVSRCCTDPTCACSPEEATCC